MPAKCCKEKFTKIPDNVPVFTLIGWDKLGIRTIRFWLAEAAANGVPVTKLRKVLDDLQWFEEYAEKEPGMMKMPD
jgi:hypothetical protein